MLKLNATRPGEIAEKMIAAGIQVGSEGVPLVSTLENGHEHVKPATGAANEVFVGFSWMHNVVPTVLSFCEEVHVPDEAPYTVQLSRRNIITGQISGRNLAAFFEINAATLAAGKFDVDYGNGLLTFHADDAGRDITMNYAYTPTVAEARSEYPGENMNINPAFEFLNSLGVILVGEVYTDQYDKSVDWSAVGNNIFLGAGMLTGAGNVKIGGHVTHVPTPENPFLGVQFSNH
jgi:hypothetical protein